MKQTERFRGENHSALKILCVQPVRVCKQTLLVKTGKRWDPLAYKMDFKLIFISLLAGTTHETNAPYCFFLLIEKYTRLLGKEFSAQGRFTWCV